MHFPDEIHSLFHFSKKKKGLLLTQPEYAEIYFLNRKVNLVSGESTSIDINEELEKLSEVKLSLPCEKPEVFHFCYELGHLLCSRETIPPNIPLFIRIKYQKTEWLEYPKKQLKQLDLFKKDEISEESYQEKFKTIMNHLVDGNCYQVNFTQLHHWKSKAQFSKEEILVNFYSSENLSDYAHHTYIPYLDKLILSNSPECLFQLFRKNDHLEIHSTPIKGTIKGDTKEQAQALYNSEKDIAELNMITDLIRNDLAKIENPRVKVLGKRHLLKVPKLWHLYSRVAVKTSNKVNLLDLLKALFPGGSVTGAPKRRVMQIIHDLEQGPRGHYCGSTFLNYMGISTASINIRTFEIDLKNQDLTLGAGGGITLKSDSEGEYQEMLHKQESLLKVLQLISYQ